MAKGQIDRRVARTRAALQRAHLALILERGYDAVTVEDICNAADVSRSTFYAHYTGKDDLKRHGLEELRHELLRHHASAAPARTREGGLRLDFSLPMFEHARDHLDLYRALAGNRGGAIAIEAIREILAEQVRMELVAAAPIDSAVERDLTVEYVVGAYMAVLTWWLNRGADLPPTQVDALFRRLAFDGVAGSAAARLSP